MKLAIFISILIILSISILINGYLPDRTLRDKLLRVLLVGFFIYFGVAFVCDELTSLKYLYISKTLPLGFLFGPIMYFLIISDEDSVVNSRAIFFHRLPFYLSLPIFIYFVLSTKVREFFGSDFYFYWNCSQMVSWIVYFVFALVKLCNKKFFKKSDIFTLTLLLLFLIVIISTTTSLYKSNFQQFYDPSPGLSIIFVFFISVIIYFQQLNELGKAIVIKVEERYCFDSNILNFIALNRSRFVPEIVMEEPVAPKKIPIADIILSSIDFLDPTLTITMQVYL